MPHNVMYGMAQARKEQNGERGMVSRCGVVEFELDVGFKRE